jgi:DNA-binding IclR family transcriptional regulator
MLAELPPAQLRALYPDRAAFAERHPEGEADAAEWSYGRLKRVLADVRARGWAAEDGEVTSGLASAGASVVDHLGWPAAAIAVTFPDDAATGLRERAVEGVREAAATLSRRIRGIR